MVRLGLIPQYDAGDNDEICEIPAQIHIFVDLRQPIGVIGGDEATMPLDLRNFLHDFVNPGWYRVARCKIISTGHLDPTQMLIPTGAFHLRQ